jgi:hypothetical protein
VEQAARSHSVPWSTSRLLTRHAENRYKAANVIRQISKSKTSPLGSNIFRTPGKFRLMRLPESLEVPSRIIMFSIRLNSIGAATHPLLITKMPMFQWQSIFMLVFVIMCDRGNQTARRMASDILVNTFTSAFVRQYSPFPRFPVIAHPHIWKLDCASNNQRHFDL